MLHVCSVLRTDLSRQDLLDAAAGDAGLQALARELAAQWFGLTPGFHRLAFDEGRVLLTVCIGEPRAMLREMDFTADAVRLEDADAKWIKSVARLCRRGASVSASAPTPDVCDALTQCGFAAVGDGPDFQYLPPWAPRGLRAAASAPAGDCMVIGAGLAGAAVAASMARRGWHVQVLDAAGSPASGASSLPAGLLAPHVSPDDSLLSRLSRSGIRMTLHHAAQWLAADDWRETGVLEHREEAGRLLPSASSAQHLQWSASADAGHKRQAMLPDDSPALWHARAGWIKPAAVVRACLDQPGVEWRGNSRVAQLRRDGDVWQALDESGGLLAQAQLVVVAAAHASAALLPRELVLQPVRGQVSWALQQAGQQLPPFPINGAGHLISHVTVPGGDAWLAGSTYVRDELDTTPTMEEQAANQERLRVLAPAIASQLDAAFNAQQVQSWTGIRCASADRRPLVGQVEEGLWLSTAMGSRGLTFALLCAELMAARIHHEPLPLAAKHAAALDLKRQLG